MLTNTFKTAYIGGIVFALPFKVRGSFIFDQQNQTLCECINDKIARELISQLNRLYM